MAIASRDALQIRLWSRIFDGSFGVRPLPISRIQTTSMAAAVCQAFPIGARSRTAAATSTMSNEHEGDESSAAVSHPLASPADGLRARPDFAGRHDKPQPCGLSNVRSRPGFIALVVVGHRRRRRPRFASAPPYRKADRLRPPCLVVWIHGNREGRTPNEHRRSREPQANRSASRWRWPITISYCLHLDIHRRFRSCDFLLLREKGLWVCGGLAMVDVSGCACSSRHRCAASGSGSAGSMGLGRPSTSTTNASGPRIGCDDDGAAGSTAESRRPAEQEARRAANGGAAWTGGGSGGADGGTGGSAMTGSANVPHVHKKPFAPTASYIAIPRSPRSTRPRSQGHDVHRAIPRCDVREASLLRGCCGGKNLVIV